MTATTQHPITVPGPPVTLSVSVAQVVGYLERTGWRRVNGAPHRYKCGYTFTVRVDPSDPYLRTNLGGVVRVVAGIEQRVPSDVLRDIAAVTCREEPAQ